MNTQSRPFEIWVELHYRYKGESYKFNLPLPQGGKFLDGLRIDFDREDFARGRRFTVTMDSLGPIRLERFVLTGHLEYDDGLKSVFVNGYQSWTASRERSPGERISALNWPGRLMGLHRAGDARIVSYSEKKGRFHGFTYAYVRFADRVFFAGSLDESTGFTGIESDIRHGLFFLTKDVDGLVLDGRRRMMDMVFLEGSEDAVFRRYAGFRGTSPHIAPRAALWTSRYAAGSDEVELRRRLAALRDRRIPMDYFVVDDGWQQAAGHWDADPGDFPSGLGSLAAEIRGSGFRPGIGFAPFIVGPESPVFRNRKGWLARRRGRRVQPAGWMPRYGGSFYALDLFRDDVRDFIADTVRRFRDEWGFDLIRMDLLYVAGLVPPEGMSRGMAMHQAAEFLASIKGRAVYQWSGVPLDSAFGRAEYCRVAADSTPYWENLFRRNIHARERASTINNLRSVVGRRRLNGLFFASDVDAFFLETRRNGMDRGRRYTQILLQALLGSLLATSDDVGSYSDDEARLFRSLFPLAEPRIDEVMEFRRTVTVHYRVGERRYVAVSNLAERLRPFMLPEGHWFGAPGLQRRAHHVAGGRRQYLKPGESRNYLLFDDDDHEGFAGSDGHIFPGSEIESITGGPAEWTVVPKPQAQAGIRVWLRIPPGERAWINGTEAEVIRTLFGTSLATALLSGEAAP